MFLHTGPPFTDGAASESKQRVLNTLKTGYLANKEKSAQVKACKVRPTRRSVCKSAQKLFLKETGYSQTYALPGAHQSARSRRACVTHAFGSV
jgi:hypothetical protein